MYSHQCWIIPYSISLYGFLHTMRAISNHCVCDPISSDQASLTESGPQQQPMLAIYKNTSKAFIYLRFGRLDSKYRKFSTRGLLRLGRLTRFKHIGGGAVGVTLRPGFHPFSLFLQQHTTNFHRRAISSPGIEKKRNYGSSKDRKLHGNVPIRRPGTSFARLH